MGRESLVASTCFSAVFVPSSRFIVPSAYRHAESRCHEQRDSKEQRRGNRLGRSFRTSRTAGCRQRACEPEAATDDAGCDNPAGEHPDGRGPPRVDGGPHCRSKQRKPHRPQERPEIAVRGTSTQSHQAQHDGRRKHHTDGAECNVQHFRHRRSVWDGRLQRSLCHDATLIDLEAEAVWPMGTQLEFTVTTSN